MPPPEGGLVNEQQDGVTMRGFVTITHHISFQVM